MTWQPTLLTHKIESNGASLTVSPAGGQVLSWKVPHSSGQQQEMLYQGSSVRRSGIPVLFPYANPLKDGIFVPTQKEMPQHGFARDCIWDYDPHTGSSLTLSLTHNLLLQPFREAYPYRFVLRQIIELTGPVSFRQTLQVINNSPVVMPIAPGLHPYFPIAHDQKKELKIEGLNGFDATRIDWDGHLEGDFFDFNGQAQAQFPSGTQIRIQEISEPKYFQYLVLWSQNSNQPDSDFVCIEPFTRPTNAINDAPILVPASGTWSSSLEYEVINLG